MLHTVGACTRSAADLHHARALFLSLAWLLPCSRCREAYGDHLRRWPFPKRAGDVQRWVFDLHNHVNRRLNVAAASTPSWETVKAAGQARPCVPDAPEAFFSALLVNHAGRYKTTPAAFLAAHVDFWAAVAHFFDGYEKVAKAATARSKTTLRAALRGVLRGAATGAHDTCNEACALPEK
jgi:hypothetical protein